MVLPLTELVRVVRRLRAKGKVIAFTNGCFDLLHAGHLDTLERIKRRADLLIVGINSDASVRRLKGPGRPLVPARERARLIAALKPVDLVAIFAEPTPLRLIRAIRPDILAKGGDWKRGEIVGRELVESYGGKVLVVPYMKSHSTSRLLQRVRQSKSR
ncbi:MAG: D-glycero-beta-D-manno-heptose 1-phosphate adenylyltransferase [Candidatus Omnitrophica bacterium]|nr:D-glycero-beta-D-manno-heptose 1-phosphate adenylyltransferase [Candidatus Omnitrophota bacterium]